MNSKLTDAEFSVLATLEQEGPMFNGDLGARTGLAFNSRVFRRLEKRGWIEGHPYRITEAGLDARSEAGDPRTPAYGVAFADH